jgi:hypothetical protein
MAVCRPATGSAPPGSPDPVHEAIALVDDFAYAYRYSQEWEQIERIRRSAAEPDRRLLEPILDSRIAGLDYAGRLLEAALPMTLGEAIDASIAAAERPGESASAKGPRARVTTGRHRSITNAIYAARGELNERLGLPLVGTAVAVSLQDLATWAEADDVGGRGAGPMLHRVRRFPNPHASGQDRLSRGPAAVATALVDRPEAMVALGYRLAEPWTRQILLKAYQLLGETSRDVGALAGALNRADECSASPRLRRLLLVAGGLVNVANAADLACEVVSRNAAAEASDVRTAILTTALTEPLRLPEVLSRLASADASGRHAELLRKTKARVKRGRILAVVPG